MAQKAQEGSISPTNPYRSQSSPAQPRASQGSQSSKSSKSAILRYLTLFDAGIASFYVISAPRSSNAPKVPFWRQTPKNGVFSGFEHIGSEALRIQE